MSAAAELRRLTTPQDLFQAAAEAFIGAASEAVSRRTSRYRSVSSLRPNAELNRGAALIGLVSLGSSRLSLPTLDQKAGDSRNQQCE